ncbi:lipase member H-A-like [Megalopta genalis]|uniref:lipase member H-A-like n=1 Tax=Megalopta genalis TaxID=115081 RepID=UPI003FD37ED5
MMDHSVPSQKYLGLAQPTMLPQILLNDGMSLLWLDNYKIVINSLFPRNDTYKEVNVATAAQLVQYLNLQENTLIHIHGYLQSTDIPQVVALINGYKAGSNYNVIGVDYRYITHVDYLLAVLLVDGVATVVVRSINDMVAAGMDRTKLIVSGFSLGAQVSAFIGRKLPFVLPKIIGAEPAGPLFNITSPSLTASDAACVICIHTDMGFYGTTQPCNHIDFYPNGGKEQQPGCSLITFGALLNVCSHARVQKYMAEAARYPNAFMGIKCNSWDDFKAGNCNQTDKIPMGLFTPCSARGNYYLTTNSASPYGRGLAGTVYKS